MALCGVVSLYIPIRRTELPSTGPKPPNALRVKHKSFLIITFKGCIHVISSYLNISRDCRHGGILKILHWEVLLDSSLGLINLTFF